jgi:hypothetical protein
LKKESPLEHFEKAIRLLQEKGWNLYKGIPGADFPAIIAQGKAVAIEPGAFYHILPAAFRDNSFDEVADHLAYASHTNQIPRWSDAPNAPSVVRGIVATDRGIAIIPAETGGPEGELIGYEFDESEVELAITRNISNYNVHYFNRIDDIAAYVVRNGITPQTASRLPGQLRWTLATRDVNPEQRVIYPADPSPFLSVAKSSDSDHAIP